jgi:hypothetical protein
MITSYAEVDQVMQKLLITSYAEAVMQKILYCKHTTCSLGIFVIYNSILHVVLA